MGLMFEKKNSHDISQAAEFFVSEWNMIKTLGRFVPLKRKLDRLRGCGYWTSTKDWVPVERAIALSFEAAGFEEDATPYFEPLDAISVLLTGKGISSEDAEPQPAALQAMSRVLLRVGAPIFHECSDEAQKIIAQAVACEHMSRHIAVLPLPLLGKNARPKYGMLTAAEIWCGDPDYLERFAAKMQKTAHPRAPSISKFVHFVKGIDPLRVETARNIGVPIEEINLKNRISELIDNADVGQTSVNKIYSLLHEEFVCDLDCVRRIVGEMVSAKRIAFLPKACEARQPPAQKRRKAKKRPAPPGDDPPELAVVVVDDEDGEGEIAERRGKARLKRTIGAENKRGKRSQKKSNAKEMNARQTRTKRRRSAASLSIALKAAEQHIGRSEKTTPSPARSSSSSI